MFYKENIDPCSKSKLTEELSSEFQKLMLVSRKNLYHAQKLRKLAHNRDTKPKSYVLSDKV